MKGAEYEEFKIIRQHRGRKQRKHAYDVLIGNKEYKISARDEIELREKVLKRFFK